MRNDVRRDLQGVPKKCTFKILRAMMGGRNFGPLWAIQVLSEGLGHFGSLWATLGHFGPLWATLGHFGCLGHFGPLWAILGHLNMKQVEEA